MTYDEPKFKFYILVHYLIQNSFSNILHFNTVIVEEREEVLIYFAIIFNGVFYKLTTSIFLIKRVFQVSVPNIVHKKTCRDTRTSFGWRTIIKQYFFACLQMESSSPDSYQHWENQRSSQNNGMPPRSRLFKTRAETTKHKVSKDESTKHVEHQPHALVAPQPGSNLHRSMSSPQFQVSKHTLCVCVFFSSCSKRPFPVLATVGIPGFRYTPLFLQIYHDSWI